MTQLNLEKSAQYKAGPKVGEYAALRTLRDRAINAGLRELQRENYPGAEENFKGAMQIDPTSGEAWAGWICSAARRPNIEAIISQGLGHEKEPDETSRKVPFETLRELAQKASQAQPAIPEKRLIDFFTHDSSIWREGSATDPDSVKRLTEDQQVARGVSTPSLEPTTRIDQRILSTPAHKSDIHTMPVNNRVLQIGEHLRRGAEIRYRTLLYEQSNQQKPVASIFLRGIKHEGEHLIRIYAAVDLLPLTLVTDIVRKLQTWANAAKNQVGLLLL